MKRYSDRPAGNLAVQQARARLDRIFGTVQIPGEPQLGQNQKQQFAKQTEKWLISPFSGGSGIFDSYGRERRKYEQPKPMTEAQYAKLRAEADAKDADRTLPYADRPKLRVIEPAIEVPESGSPRLWFAEEGLYSQLSDFARDTTRNPDEAMEYLSARIRRCKAKSRAGFIAWALQQIATQAGKHFHLKAGVVAKFDIEVSDLVSRALVNGSKYADFPRHEYDDRAGVYRVDMGSVEPIIWTIPEHLWIYAQKLWPVCLKKGKDGYYLTKTTGGEEVAAHRLVLEVTPMDRVCSRSGNFLDWTSLEVRPYVGRFRPNMKTDKNLVHKRFNTTQEQWEKENVIVLPPIKTDEGELSVIDNTASDVMDFDGKDVSFVSGNPYHRKILPNADLGDSDSTGYERNDVLDTGEEQRTKVSTSSNSR
jgi:hypothetical protein